VGVTSVSLCHNHIQRIIIIVGATSRLAGSPLHKHASNCDRFLMGKQGGERVAEVTTENCRGDRPVAPNFTNKNGITSRCLSVASHIWRRHLMPTGRVFSLWLSALGDQKVQADSIVQA